MKIVAVVPIKLNNVRLPHKNTRKFRNGHPLCWYIFKTLQQCNLIDEIYVYCSDANICQFIPQGVKFLQRDVSMNNNSTKMNEILVSFASKIDADIYVMSHATAPFISVKSFEKGLDSVINKGYDSAFTVRVLQDFIWRNGKPYNYQLDNIPRTQDLEPLYIETSGIYIYKGSH